MSAVVNFQTQSDKLDSKNFRFLNIADIIEWIPSWIKKYTHESWEETRLKDQAGTEGANLLPRKAQMKLSGTKDPAFYPSEKSQDTHGASLSAGESLRLMTEAIQFRSRNRIPAP
jgi:hypothetical protein